MEDRTRAIHIDVHLRKNHLTGQTGSPGSNYTQQPSLRQSNLRCRRAPATSDCYQSHPVWFGLGAGSESARRASDVAESSGSATRSCKSREDRRFSAPRPRRTYFRRRTPLACPGFRFRRMREGRERDTRGAERCALVGLCIREGIWWVSA